MFVDRRDAGKKLADRLRGLGDENPVVIGLPRGGVVVAAEVAKALDVPLDIVGVRKLGTPGQPELAMGAIAEEDVIVYNESVLSHLNIGDAEMKEVIASEQDEMNRRIRVFRGDKPAVSVEGRTAILIDDGLATGMTAVAAARALRRKGAGKIVLAVPVSSHRTAEAMRSEVDDVVTLLTPETFFAIGEWYMEFGQTTDEEVIDLVHGRSLQEFPFELSRDLSVPTDAKAVIVFAHGSGSSRLSPRNRAVAESLNEAGLATLLFDLLTEDESRDRRNVFDIALLADRLLAATKWVAEQNETSSLPIGYFGASTGAAAALVAAASSEVFAVVSRGGRPDMAGKHLAKVRAPTLLIVGGEDHAVLDLNRSALAQLTSESSLEVIPGATHLFEEPGALEEVTRLAKQWFIGHLGQSAV